MGFEFQVSSFEQMQASTRNLKLET